MKYTIEQKQEVIEQYANRESVLNIAQIPRSTIYSWIKESQNSNTNKMNKINLKNFRTLEKNCSFRRYY